MYILKNALRNIVRSKGRNILIGCIAFVIGLSACLALSIKEAAVSEKESGLDGIAITASIGVDRQSMMEDIAQNGEGDESEQRSDMKEQMKNMATLSIDEMKTYAKAESVKDFYYTNSTSLNGTEVEAVSTSSSTEDENAPGGGGMRGGMENQGDFTFTGYSSYAAMTSFSDGSNEITSGEVFEEGSDALECIINKELATLNSIKVGDSITFTNPSNTEETFIVKVVGIYTSNETTQSSGFMNMAMMDPANQIYMSYEALQSIADQSVANTANEESSTALRCMSNGTYVFENVDAYEAFEAQARALGLSDTYTISSSDVSAYEQSLQPLENLSKYATYFLIVILTIGGIILVVLNIYRIRERKYEIGVLAAIGMNKMKVASQFVIEIFVTTLFAILIGTGIGAISSVPLTNTLLSTQTSETTNGFSDSSRGPGGMTGKGSGMPSAPGTTNYIEEINSATNMKVIVELVGIGILLTILSGGVAVMSIQRYEPLKILSNRE
ncbi:ABC transporter permease [Amedibacillus sp. YH-ame10]